MNHKKLKVAFLGGGINSAIGRTHKIAINMDDKYELVAGCFSRHREVNHKTAAEYGVSPKRLYDDIDALIDNEKNALDAVCILTPIPNHKDEVIRCVENNLAVVCEKSLATSPEDAITIKKALEKHGGRLAVIYNYTGYPMLRVLRSMVRKNRLGKITQIHIEMPLEGFMRLDKDGTSVRPQDWRLHDNTIPTLLLDLGAHVHLLIKFLIDEHPLEVVSAHDNIGLFEGVTDNSMTIARYANDITANIWLSKTALGYRNGLKIRLYGDKGATKWYQMDPENLYVNDNQGNHFIMDRGGADSDAAAPRYNRFKAGHPSGFMEAFANYYDDIADYLAGNDKNEFVFGVDDAIEGLKMLNTMSMSNRRKEWVKV